MKLLVVAALAAGATAQFGRKKQDAADLLRDELAAEETMRATQDAMAGGARDFELENMARHKAGELNTAELGLANMQQAMRDPSVMAEVAQMMKDPSNQKALKQMMADPAFKAQAQRAVDQMKAAGGLPDMAAMMQDPAMIEKAKAMMSDPAMMAKAQQMAQAMMGGGAAGGAGDVQAEIARLRQENAALKQGRRV